MTLSRAELSAKIQWLIDIAGSRNVIEAIIHYFTRKHGRRQIKFMECNKITPSKNKIVFYTKDGEIGHWLYFDKKGNEWNSYKLQHQRDGSHQFCQTFALIYLLNDHGIKTVPKFATRLETGAWNNNLCVAVDFWRWIFNSMFENTVIKLWLENVFVELNNSYKTYNDTCLRITEHMQLLPENINKHVINDLLDDILLYSECITTLT